MRKNCWELIFCGREPGGVKAGDLGVCPAATEEKYDGMNGGKNGGRYCWRVAGTLCGGEVTGVWAAKVADCHACKFFQFVKNHEGAAFVY